jgi:putative hemolysin
VIEEHEHQMVRNVFRLDDRQIGSMMIPRAEIAWLDDRRCRCPRTWRTAHRPSNGHARYPVCRGGLDDVVGVIHAQQLLLHRCARRQARPDRAPGATGVVPETLSGMELLEHFRLRRRTWCSWSTSTARCRA